MTSKQRAFLKSLAMNIEPSVHIGKDAASPEVVKSVQEALNAHELVKIAVLNNCPDDIKNMAEAVSERTRAQVVQVIGHRIVLYRPAEDEKNRKIDLVHLTSRKG